MKKKSILNACICFLIVGNFIFAQTPNTLTVEEEKQGFRLLWDGHTTEGWRGVSSDKFPEKGWKIQNGQLNTVPSEGRGGDIVTTDSFSDFELVLDFKLAQGGNSGIKYFVNPNLPKSSLGLEYQLIDDERHPDAENGRDGNRTTASLYDMISAPKDKVLKPAGEWNTARIVCQGVKVEHWLNGVKLFDYERNSPEYQRLIALSKYKDLPKFGIGKTGRLLLQEHGDTVSFRSIKIKALPSLQTHSPFPIGFAIVPDRLEKDPRYLQVIKQEVGSITPSNHLKPSRISPQAGVYNFKEADSMIDFARSQNMRVHGHTFVWFIDTAPEWLKQIKDSTTLENTLKMYIQTVGSHFRGKVVSWDVVNEAFEDNETGNIRRQEKSPEGKSYLNLGGILGRDYVARMFEYAHATDPEALLFYNDYRQERFPKKLEAILNMVADFKRRNIPIHGLGLQMHINVDMPNEGIENALLKSAETGLLIHISELDIALNSKKKTPFTPTNEDLEKQFQKYKFVVEAYRRLVPPKQQFGITMWNVGDADSWIPGQCKCPDYPLLFNQDYQPKKAYKGFLEGLK
jgi:endo-1,4-beta-xylanase